MGELITRADLERCAADKKITISAVAKYLPQFVPELHDICRIHGGRHLAQDHMEQRILSLLSERFFCQ